MKRALQRKCSLRNLEYPIIIDEPNIVVIDYTRRTAGMSKVTEFCAKFGGYEPIDVRCCREGAEVGKKREHSYV
jgi:hypothetical protein